MHPSLAWLIPLGVTGIGALVLSVVAVVIRRDVTELQKSMRTLRVPARRSRSNRPNG